MTYNDEDQNLCPDDYLKVDCWSTYIAFGATEDGSTSMVDLDFDAVVKLQQELGQWLLEYKNT